MIRSTIIDYMFGTTAIWEAVTRCGMLWFHDRIVSNHRGLWIDLNILRLLRGEIHEIQEKNRSKFAQDVLKIKRIPKKDNRESYKMKSGRKNRRSSKG